MNELFFGLSFHFVNLGLYFLLVLHKNLLIILYLFLNNLLLLFFFLCLLLKSNYFIFKSLDLGFVLSQKNFLVSAMFEMNLLYFFFIILLGLCDLESTEMLFMFNLLLGCYNFCPEFLRLLFVFHLY